MIYISIGIDCGPATFLKTNHMRSYSLPFDWTLTYNGISEIIKNKFSSYLPTNNNCLCSHSSHTHFIHNNFPQDTEKMTRRIQRFSEILKIDNEEIIFIRKGHAIRHHDEASKFNFTIKNDLIDAEEFCEYLLENYPILKFKIIIFLICGNCFDKNNIYMSKYRNISVINISTHNIDEENSTFLDYMNHLLRT